MSTFVDTSAFLAVLDGNEQNHAAAATTWRALVESDEPLIVTNYILVETFALTQNRLGMEAVRAFQTDVVPLLKIHWIDEAGHAAAVEALLAANRRQLSLVDCTSFEIMRRLGLKRVFAFDEHFAEQGFICVP